jgi:hypothetical protein
MAENPESNSPLNQLQTEFNAVLEQIGRLIKAASKDGKDIPLQDIPLPEIFKVKQVVPRTQNRFHNALDRLEDQLVIYITLTARDLH